MTGHIGEGERSHQCAIPAPQDVGHTSAKQLGYKTVKAKTKASHLTFSPMLSTSSCCWLLLSSSWFLRNDNSLWKGWKSAPWMSDCSSAHVVLRKVRQQCEEKYSNKQNTTYILFAKVLFQLFYGSHHIIYTILKWQLELCETFLLTTQSNLWN